MEVGVKFLAILQANIETAYKHSGVQLGLFSWHAVPSPFDNNIRAVLAFENSMVHIGFQDSRLHRKAACLIPDKHECIHFAQLHTAWDTPWPTSPDPGPKPLDGSILLKFYWKRWLKSPPLVTSLTKNPHPPTKKIFWVQTKDWLRLWTFEQLSTTFGTRVTLAQSHVRSDCFGAKIFRTGRTPKC